MAYPATELITNSFFLSGVLGRDLQVISGSQLAEGLSLLNSVIAIKSADTRLIPYYSQYEFTATVGQEKYPIPGLLSVETFTFNIGQVRFATIQVPRKTYFGSGRVDNINSLPFSWHLERALGGSNLFVYFNPGSDYVLKITGQFALPTIPNQAFDLSTAYDTYYIEYFRYALCELICHAYQKSMLPECANKLKQYEAIITDISPPDLTVTKTSSLKSGPYIGWGFVNLSQGWTVP